MEHNKINKKEKKHQQNNKDHYRNRNTGFFTHALEKRSYKKKRHTFLIKYLRSSFSF